MSMALGLCMMTIGLSSIMIAQDERDTSVLRQDNAASVLVTDSAIAQVLADLTTRSNAILLNRNYDPINPQTGKTYLGNDGLPNTGDETSDAVDEWTKYTAQCLTAQGESQPNLSFIQGDLDQKSQYQLLAYRYDAGSQKGLLLIEGRHQGLSSYVLMTVDVIPESTGFPGVISRYGMYWQGRTIVGQNGNVFFSAPYSANTSLNQSADPGDTSRADYLNAIWSGSDDGFVNDTIQGKLVACDFSFSSALKPQGTKIGNITSGRTLNALGPAATHYQIDKIDLSGSDELIVDTTAGPVQLYLNGSITLRGSAKIVNSRSDGLPTRVGDLRISGMLDTGSNLALFDQSCIDTAFLFYPMADIQLLTKAEGCGAGSHSNVVGVVWAENFVNSINNSSARSFSDGNDDFVLTTNNAFPGITVPEDVSTLADAMTMEGFPQYSQVRSIVSWERVDL